MKSTVLFINLLGFLAYGALLIFLREKNWIWGQAPSGWMLFIVSFPIIYFVACFATAFARKKSKLLFLIGICLNFLVLIISTIAIIQNSSWGYSVFLVYVFSWCGMYYFLPD